MLVYKGVRCAYLTLGRWKVHWKGWDFDIVCKGGIKELIENIERWKRHDY